MSESAMSAISPGSMFSQERWTAPWTAALDMKVPPADAGVFEYACHEGNYGLHYMLSTSRLYDR